MENLLFYKPLIKILNDTMRSITHCLNKQLAAICLHSAQLEELSNKVKQLLPENLSKECRVGSFNKGCLVLTTASSVWATPLRYAIPELRDKLRKEYGLYHLTSIKLTVSEPTRSYEKPAQIRISKLSEQAKATIIEESQQCTYEPLRKAWLHLAE